jgi:hypothetical protein
LLLAAREGSALLMLPLLEAWEEGVDTLEIGWDVLFVRAREGA